MLLLLNSMSFSSCEVEKLQHKAYSVTESDGIVLLQFVSPILRPWKKSSFPLLSQTEPKKLKELETFRDLRN